LEIYGIKYKLKELHMNVVTFLGRGGLEILNSIGGGLTL